MLLRATAFEFRWRFFILALIFGGCFWASARQGQLGHLWILLTFFLSKLGLTNESGSLLLKVVVSALAVSAAALRTWAAAYLHTSVVQDHAVLADRILTGGPYAWLRNPLYLGILLLTLSLAPVNGPWEALSMIVLVTALILRLIGREEFVLTTAQGEPYLRYKAAVSSLLPRLQRGGLARGDARPRWVQAFLGEIMMWTLAAGVVIYSITFRSDWLGRAALIGIGLNFVTRGLMMPRSAS